MFSGKSFRAPLSDLVGLVPSRLNMFLWGETSHQTDFTDTSFYVPANATVSSVSDSPTTETTTTNVLTEDSANSTHLVQCPGIGVVSANMSSAIPYRLSAIVKANGRNRVVLSWKAISNSTNSAISAGFDLVGGNTNYDVAQGSAITNSAVSMRPLGNGWWLCKIDFTYGAGRGPMFPQIFLDNGSSTAARSTSYTGDGTSGVKIFWFNFLPRVAHNLNTLSLSDDFTSTSTIDMANSKSPGFNWYINNDWPNAPLQNLDLKQGPTASGNLTISSPSVLKIFNPSNNQNGYTSEIMSCCTDGSNGFIGKVWGAPVLFEAFMSWDGTVAGFNSNWNPWPAMWGESIEFRTGNGTTGFYLEIDHIEAQRPPPNDSFSTSGYFVLNLPDGSVNLKQSTVNTTNFRIGTFKRISTLWINGASQGGVGLVMSFLDGRFLINSDQFYDSTTSPHDAIDLHRLPLIINTGENVTANAGGGWPMFVDYCKVFTL